MGTGVAVVEKVVPFLRVADARAAADWYARIGFTITGEHTFGEGMPVFLHLSQGEVDLYLSEHRGDAPRRGLIYLWVSDIHAIADQFAATVSEAPWALEADLTDPDGNRVRLGQKPDATT